MSPTIAMHAGVPQSDTENYKTTL